MRIILASASPRRRELLSILGHDVLVMVPQFDELDASSGLMPDRLALINAQNKAREIYNTVGLEGRDVIIGADTVVVASGLMYGKPKNYDDAFLMLKQLSRAPHEVITAFALIGPNQQEIARSVSSTVEFRPLFDDEIKSYLKSEEWRDKAGGYGVQGLGAALIRRVIGSITNVIGLPIEEVLTDAQAIGLKA